MIPISLRVSELNQSVVLLGYDHLIFTLAYTFTFFGVDMHADNLC